MFYLFLSELDIQINTIDKQCERSLLCASLFDFSSKSIRRESEICCSLARLEKIKPFLPSGVCLKPFSSRWYQKKKKLHHSFNTKVSEIV